MPLDIPDLPTGELLYLGTMDSESKTGMQVIETQTPEQSLIGGIVDAAIVDSSVWSQLKPSGSYSAISDFALSGRGFVVRIVC